MHVRYGADFWSRRVDSRVYPELGIGLAFALTLVAVQVENQEPSGVREGRAGAGREQERVRRAWHSGADVPEAGH